MKSASPLSSSNKLTVWARLFTLTSLAAYFYVFMEWLFFVAVPSFIDLASPAELVYSGRRVLAWLGLGALAGCPPAE